MLNPFDGQLQSKCRNLLLSKCSHRRCWVWSSEIWGLRFRRRACMYIGCNMGEMYVERRRAELLSSIWVMFRVASQTSRDGGI